MKFSLIPFLRTFIWLGGGKLVENNTSNLVILIKVTDQQTHTPMVEKKRGGGISTSNDGKQQGYWKLKNYWKKIQICAGDVIHSPASGFTLLPGLTVNNQLTNMVVKDAASKCSSRKGINSSLLLDLMVTAKEFWWETVNINKCSEKLVQRS